jgi:phage-related protein
MADYNIRINAQDNASGALNNVNKGLGGVAASAGRVKAAIGVAAAGIAALGVAGQIQGTIDNFDSLAKSARAAGAASSNEAFKGFQVLKQAMNEAGIDAATFDRAMLQTTTRLKEGVEGNKAFVDITNKLGSSIQTANGQLKEGPALLQAMINGLNEGTISTDEFAKVVGGRAGPLIQQQFASIAGSAEGLSTILADVEANSNIVGLEAAENAEKFNDTVGRLKEAMGQLMTDAVTPLLPLLNDLAENVLANMPAIIEGVQTAFSSLEPVISLIGTVLTDLVFPIMQKVFEILGKMAEAIAPLVEQAIPHLKEGFDNITAALGFVFDKIEPLISTALPAIKEGFDFLTDTLTSGFEAMKSVYDTALPALKTGFGFVKDGVDATFNSMKPLYEGALPAVQGGMDKVKGALGFVFDKMKSVYDTAIPALKSGLEKVRSIIEGLVGWINKISEKLGYLKDKAVALKNGVTGAMSSMKDSVVSSTGQMVDGMKRRGDEIYQYWFGGSTFPDLRDGVVMTMDQMKERVLGHVQTMVGGMIQKADNMVPGFSNVMNQLTGSAMNGTAAISGAFDNMFSGLNSMFSNGLSGLLGKFKNFGGGIGNIFGGLTSKLFGSSGLGNVLGKVSGGAGRVFSGIKSAFSGISSGIGKALGGLFGRRAMGGQVRGGQAYVVGENRPELFVPSGNGRIEPRVGGGGGSVNINFTVNSLDPQTAASVIVQNKKVITGIIQDAYNRRGRVGI